MEAASSSSVMRSQTYNSSACGGADVPYQRLISASSGIHGGRSGAADPAPTLRDDVPSSLPLYLATEERPSLFWRLAATSSAREGESRARREPELGLAAEESSTRSPRGDRGGVDCMQSTRNSMSIAGALIDASTASVLAGWSIRAA